MKLKFNVVLQRNEQTLLNTKFVMIYFRIKQAEKAIVSRNIENFKYIIFSSTNL